MRRAVSSRRRPWCRRAVGAVAVAALAGLAPGASAGGRDDATAASLSPTFGMIARSFLDLAEAMPAEQYAFKPATGEFREVRTFGEQVKHVACANYAFFDEIEGKEPPADCAGGGPSPAKTKAELTAYLRDSFAYAQGVLAGTTAANALDPVTGPYGGPSTRLGIATLAVWHASDHYGQLVVYLRLNGIVPPASRRAR